MSSKKVGALLVALSISAAIVAGVAAADRRGENGRITFARFNPALHDTQVYVINPDGTGERRVQGAGDPGGCPRWFPDGEHIATCGAPSPDASTRIIDANDGSFRDVPSHDPSTLFAPCGWPSPNGSRLLCEVFGFVDDSVNGIFTERSKDGSDFQRVTSNPGGDDVPLSWSPNGRQVVFLRFGPNVTQGMFVVNVDGTGLRQIMPGDARITCCGADWSRRSEIVFSMHASADVHSSLWVVRADGTNLHQVAVQPANACGGLNADPTADGCFDPGWSPDGRQIVFAKGQSGDRDGQVYIVGADGTGLTQVTHTPGSQWPDWSSGEDDDD